MASVITVTAWLAINALQAADEEWGGLHRQTQVKNSAIVRAHSALDNSGRRLVEGDAVQEESAIAQEQLARAMSSLFQAYSELGALSREEYEYLAELRVAGAAYRSAAMRAMAQGGSGEAAEVRSLLIRSAMDASYPFAESLHKLHEASTAAMQRIDSSVAQRSRQARVIVGGTITAALLLLLLSTARIWRSPLL
ncbi:hypothetical protein AB4Z19_27810 [Pseudoduganella sp. RAF19]|uniref:hypothetical protein n=2 Tax=unclassified Pseudoduganella TaxID=2637179 RepID=UPI003F944E3A